MAARNVEVVEGMYEAFGRGDVPAVLGAMAADIEWVEAESLPYRGPHHGPQEVAERAFAPVLEDIHGAVTAT